MKLSRLLSLSLAGTGAIVAGRVLSRRIEWERRHNRVAICVDYADAWAASIRAAMPFDELLGRLAGHGATHLSLPELTLNRLCASGLLAPRAPAAPMRDSPPVGHWNHLGGPAHVVAQVASELAARLPYTAARTVDECTLTFAGDLRTIGEVGLGFDADVAHRIAARGLALVPRPVSYAWPEGALIDLSLAQAAVFGRLVAFDGDMILGHELHLEETLAAMEREGLALVYFAESRHQKGDWFVAKRRGPNVVLAHSFTAAEMLSLDDHTAAYRWAYLARERGIRLCYLNFFKVLHATSPLGGLHYVEHTREALEGSGFVVTADVGAPTPVPAPDRDELTLAGLAAAGIASAAAAATLRLGEPAAIGVTVAAAGGAAALPVLDRPRGDLERRYPPSYAPKLLALAAASLAPAAVARAGDRAGWAGGVLLQAAAAVVVAALTSGPDYHLRVEEYRGLNLDWLLPLGAAAARVPDPALRVGTLALLGAAWATCVQRNIDPLVRFDPAHAEGHTHHLSAASRLAGDVQMALGPRPARKWAGLGPLAAAFSVVLGSHGKGGWASAAALAAAAGGALGLVGFRRPERALLVTAREAIPSMALGTALGALALLATRRG